MNQGLGRKPDRKRQPGVLTGKERRPWRGQQEEKPRRIGFTGNKIFGFQVCREKEPESPERAEQKRV